MSILGGGSYLTFHIDQSLPALALLGFRTITHLCLMLCSGSKFLGYDNRFIDIHFYFGHTFALSVTVVRFHWLYGATQWEHIVVR